MKEKLISSQRSSTRGGTRAQPRRASTVAESDADGGAAAAANEVTPSGPAHPPQYCD